MLESGIRHGGDQFVGRLSIRLNDDGMIVALGRIEERPEPFERNFLIAKINRWHGTAGDADDLLVLLSAEEKWRRGSRYRHARLQNEIGAEEQEENQQKHDVDQRKDDEPAKIVLFGPAELHPKARRRFSDRALLREGWSTFQAIAEN